VNDQRGDQVMQQAPGTFEDLYRELEEIVKRLEVGDLPLADSLALFERGAALTEQCNSMLDQAELRVRQLVARADGSAMDDAIESVQGLEDWQNGG
jgi:exodeoxyribonuclease VII small subunit